MVEHDRLMDKAALLADPEWRVFVNDAWADLPPEYRPDPAYTYENYW